MGDDNIRPLLVIGVYGGDGDGSKECARSVEVGMISISDRVVDDGILSHVQISKCGLLKVPETVNDRDNAHSLTLDSVCCGRVLCKPCLSFRRLAA